MSPGSIFRKSTFPAALLLVLGLVSLILAKNRIFNTSPSIAVKIDVPIRTIGSVSVFWDNIPNPNPQDFISVFNPPYVMNQFGPQGIEIYSIPANTSNSYSLGRGKITVKLANLRTKYNFGYWSRGKLIAVSPEVPVYAEYPAQGHLAIDKDNRVIVMWADLNYDSPLVYYGTDPKNLDRSVSTSSYSYGIQDLVPCAINYTSVAIEMFRDPGALHSATLPVLPPNTLVYYKFGSVTHGFSQLFEFETPPPVAHDQETVIVAYADMGTSLCLDPIGGWCGLGVNCVVEYLAKQIKSNVSSYDNLIHIGDLSYAVARAYRWDMWMNEIEPIAARVPLGNHEFDYVGQHFLPSWSNFYNDSDGECGVPTKSRFVMPWKEAEWWYSYDVGNVHVVMLTFERDFLKGSDQYKWFLNDISSLDRTRTPWLIVTGHRPLYSSGVSDEDHLFSKHIRDQIETDLFKYKVDLFLTGHYHNYERTCAMYEEKCVQDKRGPVHVVIGTAGIELEDDWIHPQPEWSRVRGVFYGHSRITAFNASVMMVEAIKCDNGDLFDKFYLVK